MLIGGAFGIVAVICCWAIWRVVCPFGFVLITLAFMNCEG